MSVLKIYYTIEDLVKTEFAKESAQFIKGFEACLFLFKIGIEKRTDFNLLVRNRELELENKHLKSIVTKKYKKIQDMERDLKLTSLISGNPLELYREVLIETQLGNFTLVVNMDEDTIKACVINFSLRNSFKELGEGKNKLLQYINNKKDFGFRAFKDKNVAIKEGAVML